MIPDVVAASAVSKTPLGKLLSPRGAAGPAQHNVRNTGQRSAGKEAITLALATNAGKALPVFVGTAAPVL